MSAPSPSSKPVRIFTRLAAAVLALVVAVAPLQAVLADDAEPEASMSLLDQVDHYFGKLFVTPLATVMFFDLVAWDATLPLGELPEADGGYKVGDAVVTEYRDGEGYVYRDLATAPLDGLVPVPNEGETVDLAGRVAVLSERGDDLIATTEPLAVTLAPCEAFESCGEPVPDGATVADNALQLADIKVLSPPADLSMLRILRDRGPHPIAVVQADDGKLQGLTSVHAVERSLLTVEPGRQVRYKGDLWDVQSVDQQATLWSRAARVDPAPLANPNNLEVPVVVAWLVFGAVFFTLRMQFVNLRAFGHAIAVTMGRYDSPDDEGEISHFKALASALSATVGLGNIAGVAVAVTAGGPGAIPWMIIAGFLGMSSKFTECSLGQMYRSKDAAGQVSGGPMHYLYKGLAERNMAGLGQVLAIVFALMCIGGSLGGGNMFQSNQAFVSVAAEVPALADKPWLFGIIMAVLVGLVILGGIKRIGATAGVIVPVMCGVYVVAALYILVVNADRVPEAFGVMLSSAFSLKAGVGGVIGALIQGFRRAAFSNEAGVGSASIAHSAAATDEPVREGIVALLEPFIDTIVVCTMTGLVVVVTKVYEVEGLEGVAMTSQAFASALPWFPTVLSVAVVLFAFSTMVSWSYYGERCAVHLFGEGASLPYKVLFVFCTFLGAILQLDNVITFSDLMILGMAFPNIIGLLILSGKVKDAFDDYWQRLQSGAMTPTS